MTTELTMLTYAVALLILLVLVQALSGVRAQGLMPLAGPRDGLPAPAGFHARMLRVVDNHREGLVMFAPLVLVAAAVGLSNDWTVLGAQLFFWSRLVHAVLYIAGVPMVRPLAWAVGLAGTFIVLLALLGVLA
ncbi:MAG: MAPEG family protein [Hyphomonadaceae bacterium]